MNQTERQHQSTGETNGERENRTGSKEVLDFDQALAKVGGFGKFQYYVSIVLIASFATKGWIVYGLTFLLKFPEYLCLDNGGSNQWSQCPRQHICEKKLEFQTQWKIDDASLETFNNWAGPNMLDLTCVSDSQVGMIGSLYFFGLAISSAVVPPISDKYGRKWNFYSCFVLQTVFYVMLFFSRSIYWTMALYFMIGLCSGSFISVSTTYMNEFLPTANQNLITSLLNASDALVVLSQAFYYSVNKNWVPLHVFGVAMSIVLLFALLKIPESPKYLYARKEFDLARKSLKQVAEENGIPNFEQIVDKIKFDTEITMKASTQKEQDNEEEALLAESDNQDDHYVSQGALDARNTVKLTGNLSDIVRVPQIRTNMLVLAVMLSTASFSFFNFNFLMKNVKGSIIQNSLCSATSELIADLISGVIFSKLGPRRSFSLMFFSSLLGTLLLIQAIRQNELDLLMVFIPLAKFGCAACFNMCFIANVQLIPTLFASTVFGLCNCLSRAITIMAPQVAELKGSTPLIINAVMVGISAIAAMFFVEKQPKYV